MVVFAYMVVGGMLILSVTALGLGWLLVLFLAFLGDEGVQTWPGDDMGQNGPQQATEGETKS